MQKFTKQQHQKFINYFNIKENPSEIELDFFKKTNFYLKFIKWIPWLRMVWVWNSLSMYSTTEKSDIDLFIVTTKDSMWINRILITFIFQILWVRKTSKKHSWKFCLSFFCTIDWLDFKSWKLENDIYLYFWIIYFKPILDYNNTYSLFLEKNSSWADFTLYNDTFSKNKSFIKYKKNYKKNIFTLIIVIWGFNNILKTIFLQKTLKSYKNINKPYWIIISNNLLKFHNDDIRKNIIKELI